MTAEDEALARFKDVMSKQESVESRMAGLSFTPKSGDVMIVTPPKCGTTWVQQIVQSLRTRGSMEFEEICLTIPCLEMAIDHGLTDLQADQEGCLRAFKTHFWRPDCPLHPEAKYIYVIRDPAQAATSFYHFMEGWCFETGTIGIDAFMKSFVLGRNAPASPQTNAGFWHHLASWYPHRKDPNVLWLHYEDLLQDLPQCVREIAAHIGIEMDTELEVTAVEQATMAHMRRHASKYDEHTLKANRNAACGLPADAGMCGANQGKVREGPKAMPSPEILAALQQQWVDVARPVCEADTYEEMRIQVNVELGRTFHQPTPIEEE